MIAVDTNILVYAHRADSPFYKEADFQLTKLAESGATWAIPWPCIHEFLAIVTHPKIYAPPTPLSDALTQVEYWIESPSLTLIGESDDYWPTLKNILKSGKISGPHIHDARIASICRDHNIKIIWSADRNFIRMDNLEIVNPLVGATS